MKDIQEHILDFWFVQTQPKQWFDKNDDFDALITKNFSAAYESAVKGAFDTWTQTAEGALALIILLDQMPRNMFRGTPKAFASDDKALTLAKNAVSKGFDKSFPAQKRRFFYLPYEHSEDLSDQKRCVDLFEAIKEEDQMGYDYALRHLEVIQNYGRFPHRNQILGRDNTPKEQEYLARPDAGF